MASQNPPRSSDDMILFALEQALREVWAVLKAHDPHGYLDKDDGLHNAIADKLISVSSFEKRVEYAGKKRRNCRRCCGVRYQQFSDKFDHTDDPHQSHRKLRGYSTL